MTLKFTTIGLAAIALSGAAMAQIATSNERGATGAYAEDIDSSFTAETRFGPRTALDDLRAGVDREREAREKLRQRQMLDSSLSEDENEETVVIAPEADVSIESETAVADPE
ncbi:hypothetical protein [Henriciella litoralis]|uniref:hypothetical protein n=1 Tax=Henriciella litoralis TaxID=568102 RepID=UPI00111BDC69|nr:hypothetical protein [Henriciella litoralis]